MAHAGNGMAFTLALIVLAALGVSLLMYLTQDRLIFYPRPMPETHREQLARSTPDIDSVFIAAGDGTRLHAWHVGSASPSAALVLYFGGNAEEVSWMIGQARTHMPEAAWLLTDYRGYGSSAGAPSERAMASDALAWYDYARQRLGAARIYVFGRSLGSALAVRVAAEREVVGVVTVTPFDSLRAVASHYYPFLPVRWLLKHPFDSLSLAPRIGAPLLCLVATDDEVIPAEHSRRLAAAWGGATTVVELEGATHNDTDDSPLFWRSFRIFAQLGYIPAGSPAASRR